ncbi:hypothetical protein LCGC14_2110770 [marine sediment metagenome]|uniref:DNA helicase DnaB-like N-terminal domain-containing protein n=1 Tax=marine sediment metagenome TaxID=412755 RepID=A0A0F9EUB8_9ZZZZ
MSKEIASAHEAEKRLLACILINPSCADDVLMLVSTADMSCLPHNILYTTIEHLRIAGAEISVEALIANLKKRRLLDVIGGIAYLAEIAQAESDPAVYLLYVEVIIAANHTEEDMKRADEIIEYLSLCRKMRPCHHCGGEHPIGGPNPCHGTPASTPEECMAGFERWSEHKKRRDQCKN